MKTTLTQEKQNLVSLKQATSSLLNRYANLLSQELEEPVSPGRDCSFSHRNLQISKKTHTFVMPNYIMVRPFRRASVMLINKMGNFFVHNKNIRLYIQQSFALWSGTLCSLATGYYSRFSVYNAKLHKVMKTLTTQAISNGTYRVQPSLSLIKRYANFLSQELEEPVSPGRAILLSIVWIPFIGAVLAGIGLNIFLFILFMTTFVVIAYHAGMFPEWKKGGER